MKTVQDFINKDLGELQETLNTKEHDIVWLSTHQDGPVISGYANGEKTFFLKPNGRVFLDADLQKQHKECQEKIRQIKEECNEALNQFIAYFNTEMSGSAWSIKRRFFKQGGFRRSIFEVVIPDNRSYARCLDNDGTTDLATPADLLAIIKGLHDYQAEIFRAKLGASLNRKPTTTVRGHKI
ncbi:conserved hypothetical protein [Burkholderia cenocepacia]|uniref:hypothetical protein n=1 Tax=Burkholderia cenocepacia TaxID=95486 RepID=UPI00192BCA70|nr:hypothetical protein [Burkholderia cenocepacia]CAD9228018.1 conserved hypothetical protein [Burkholderia cenocepacia]